jgi:undecaprenyl-diphosphatase
MRVLLLAAIVFLAPRGACRQAVWLTLCGILGWALQQAAKAAVDRPRPDWPDPVDTAHYAAFPSGRAMNAAITCGALLWLFLLRFPHSHAPWRATAWDLGLVFVLGVSFTRVYLGVHWPTDVIAGRLLGAAVLTGAAALCAPWQAERASPDQGNVPA